LFAKVLPSNSVTVHAEVVLTAAAFRLQVLAVTHLHGKFPFASSCTLWD
jgi:hypothetical protein